MAVKAPPLDLLRGLASPHASSSISHQTGQETLLRSFNLSPATQQQYRYELLGGRLTCPAMQGSCSPADSGDPLPHCAHSLSCFSCINSALINMDLEFALSYHLGHD